MTEGLYSRRHQEPVRIVVPYPFLNEPTALAVKGVSNTSIPFPQGELQAGQWYTVQNDSTVTIPSNRVVIAVREVGNYQRMFWEEVGTQVTYPVKANDHILIASGTLPIITIAGFDLMTLGDISSLAGNNSLVQFSSSIKFPFVESA